MPVDLGEILKVLSGWAGEPHDGGCPRDGSPCRHSRAAIAIVEVNNAAARVARPDAEVGDPARELLRILLKRHHPCRHGSRLASCAVGDWMRENEGLLVGLRGAAPLDEAGERRRR